jgi:hypothetical protein
LYEIRDGKVYKKVTVWKELWEHLLFQK